MASLAIIIIYLLIGHYLCIYSFVLTNASSSQVVHAFINKSSQVLRNLFISVLLVMCAEELVFLVFRINYLFKMSRLI